MQAHENIVITGLGRVMLAPDSTELVEPRDFLKKRKTRKYMGLQDDLAVVAAGRALQSAGLGADLGEKAGLFMVVGHIPFEREQIDPLVEASMRDGELSMQAFSTDGLASVSPLITFRCLPNMPAYHISANFDVQGPYLVAYPGPGQVYQALERAQLLLDQGHIDVALVGAVAAQRNFLVRHHVARLPAGDPDKLADAAAFMILERAGDATRRGAKVLGTLQSFSIDYTPHNPFEVALEPSEHWLGESDTALEAEPFDLGAASLLASLARLHEAGHRGVAVHVLKGRCGTVARSVWSLGEGVAKTADRPAEVRHRVVVTGMGIVSPLGYELETFQENLFAGVSGIGPITLFDAADLPTRIAGEVPWGEESIEMRDRKIVFAVHAARQAMGAAGEAGPVGGAQAGEGAGLCLGLGLELFSLEDMVELRRGGAVPTPSSSLKERLEFLQTPSDLCLHLISEEHGLSEAPTAHVSACAAGADAIGDAFHLIASGRRRWMLAGGTDSMINPMGVGGFCLLRATSTENDEPETASRPFDQTRTGFVMAEGAAILVLERLDDALARGATIHAELAGYGGSFDASAITAPHPEGRGAQLAMNRALADAQLAPEHVGAINAHGTSTPMNDGIETLAIKAVFGTHAAQIPVVSTKSMTGHLIAAAGALESVAAISCLEAGRLHPTINLRTPDPECDLDYVPNESREHAHDVVLSNSFGFGGQNASLVFKRWVES